MFVVLWENNVNQIMTVSTYRANAFAIHQFAFLIYYYHHYFTTASIAIVLA